MGFETLSLQLELEDGRGIARSISRSARTSDRCSVIAEHHHIVQAI